MSSSQSTPRLIALMALAAAAGAVGLIATDRLPGFGREDAGGRQVLVRALTDDSSAKSGRFAGNVSLQIDGAPAQVGPVNMQVTGAFSGGATETQQKVALDASMTAAAQSVSFGVVSTVSQVFVRFGSTHYEIPRSQLRQAYDARALESGKALAAIGIDPGKWFDGAKDKGSADVGGVETQHVSAHLNLVRIVDDLLAAARKLDPAGLPQEDVSDANEYKDAVKDPRIDAYVGKADGVLRRVTVHARMETKQGGGDIDADFTISEVGEPQRISAPPSSKPISQLESDLGSGGLDSLFRLGAAGPPPGAGSAPPPSADPGTARSKAPAGDDTSYLGCVRKATTAAALQRCSGRLP